MPGNSENNKESCKNNNKIKNLNKNKNKQIFIESKNIKKL